MNYNTTVQLKNGREYQFVTEHDGAYLTGMKIFIASDGTVYSVRADEILTIIKKPLVKCPHCGKDILPSTETVYSGGKKIEETKTCPECGAEIPVDKK